MMLLLDIQEELADQSVIYVNADIYVIRVICILMDHVFNVKN